MKKRWWVWLIAALAVLGLLAGGLFLIRKENTETIAGAKFTLEQGGKAARIRLDSNPSTGYEWSYQISPEGMLLEVSQEYEPTQVPEGYVGAGGTQVYVFAAQEGARGNVTLLFEEARPWEEEVILSYRVDLTVKENGTLSLVDMSRGPLLFEGLGGE